MRLPGFTAESSLYRATNLYQMAGVVSGNEGGLYPAQDLEMLNPIDSIAEEIPEISGDITGDIAYPCQIVCYPPICRRVCLPPPIGRCFILCTRPICRWVC